MKRMISFALAASVLAFIIIIGPGTSSAQTTGSEQKVANQEKVANQVKAANQEKLANQAKVSNKVSAGRGEKWGAFDDDGDGIVNCQDPDYVLPRDGTGKKLGKMHGGKGMYGNRAGYGQQGSGGMTGGAGTGVCDGTGPKGKGRGR